MRILVASTLTLSLSLAAVVARADGPRVLDWEELQRERPDDFDAEDAAAFPRSRRSGELPPTSFPMYFSIAAWREIGAIGKTTGGLLVLSIPLARIGDPRTLAPLTRVSYVLPQTETDSKIVRFRPDEIRELVQAAYRSAGLLGDDRLDGLASRARLSAALPELRLRTVRTIDDGLRLQPTDLDPTRTYTSTGASMFYEARATWRLDRLAFADDEVALERLRFERAVERHKVATRIAEALGAWVKAHDAATRDASAPDPEGDRTAREIAATALLDALSDGAFSKLLEAREAR